MKYLGEIYWCDAEIWVPLVLTGYCMGQHTYKATTEVDWVSRSSWVHVTLLAFEWRNWILKENRMLQANFFVHTI